WRTDRPPRSMRSNVPSSAAAARELGEAGGPLAFAGVAGSHARAAAYRVGRRRLLRADAGLARDHVGALGDPLQGLRAYRPRLREQEALAVAHVVVEQIDHAAFALDLLSDQVDAEAADQIGEIGGMDVGRRGGAAAIEQQARLHLDEAE